MRFKLLIAIALLLSLAVAAYAHPGRTDSNGGHTDHSSGEYHYHHGYPEHQHTDTDGDGILDCPYGKTAVITKPRDEITSSSAEVETPTIEAESSKETTPEKKQKKKISFEGIMLIAFGAVVVVGLAVDWISKAIKKK